MKKHYETPSAEKIAFCYRDQIVTASGESGSETPSGTPGFGDMVGNESIGASGCKLHLLESIGIGICDIL